MIFFFGKKTGHKILNFISKSAGWIAANNRENEIRTVGLDGLALEDDGREYNLLEAIRLMVFWELWEGDNGERERNFKISDWL